MRRPGASQTARSSRGRHAAWLLGSVFVASSLAATSACSSAGDDAAESEGNRAGTNNTGQAGRRGSSGGSSGPFTIQLELSSKIQTVGIVTFSSSEPFDGAFIEFGRDQNAFEYRAPVDPKAPSYRTLLLGMKPSTTYYVRLTTENGGSTQTSAVYSLKTGFLPNGLPIFDVRDENAGELWSGGGFTVQCTGLITGGFPGGSQNAPDESYAFIFDKDGDPVWAYELTDTQVAACSRARMSVDGKYLWAGNFNNAGSMGRLMRVTLDGLEPEENYTIRARNHDFAFLPNGHILYWEQQNGGGYTNGSEGPDIIRAMDPETQVVTDIYDQMDDFAEQIDEEGAHTNQINYVPELAAISFSMRHTSTIGLISYPEGELLNVFGGPTTRYSNMAWAYQHGHHVRENTLFVFNNEGDNGGSSILGFRYGSAASSATQTLDYSSGKKSGAFGDVKELSNGNLYVTYSTSGVIHETSPSGTLLREITTSASLGYSEHRATLYGPPPPFDEK